MARRDVADSRLPVHRINRVILLHPGHTEDHPYAFPVERLHQCLAAGHLHRHSLRIHPPSTPPMTPLPWQGRDRGLGPSYRPPRLTTATVRPLPHAAMDGLGKRHVLHTLLEPRAGDGALAAIAVMNSSSTCQPGGCDAAGRGLAGGRAMGRSASSSRVPPNSRPPSTRKVASVP